MTLKPHVLNKKVKKRTVMVNLLYGNSIGISEKKSSSYSSSLIARMARLASGGFREGGNLPFCSHDSTRVDKSTTNDTIFNETLYLLLRVP